MRGGNRRRTVTDVAASIPVQATGTGAVVANAFAGWTNLAGGSIASIAAYGVTAKYLLANAEQTIFAKSKASSFDQEVTFWSARARVYLRLTEAGKALCIDLSTSGAWQVFYVPSVASDTFFDTGYQLGSGTPSGINMAATNGDTWTFGVSGLDIYVKWNGVEQWRAKQIFHLEPGKVGLRTLSTDYGFRSVVATFHPTTAIHSSPAENWIDVRDVGLKCPQTTGSMMAGSPLLVVNDATDLVVGNSIIVEIGGEAGAGMPGTRGVGGQWPTLTYANATAMNADTGQAYDKVAALLNTGYTYRWSGASWVKFSEPNYPSTSRWHSQMLPMSLVATIIGKSGNTLTLNKNAVVETNNTNVYFNNLPALEATIGFNYEGAGIPTYVDNRTIYYPNGRFQLGPVNVVPGFMGGKNNWAIAGKRRTETAICTPMGVTGLRIQMESKANSRISDLEIRSNGRGDKGWIFFYDANDLPIQFAANLTFFQTSVNVTFERIKVTNSDFGLNTCTDSIMSDIESHWEVGQRMYVSWQVGMANCLRCRGTNIRINNDSLVTALEIFGGHYNQFDNVRIVNGKLATNSADDWVIDGVEVVLERGCANDPVYGAWVVEGTTLVDINSNIDPLTPRGNGVFKNFDITINYANDANYLFNGFNVSGGGYGILIQGNYPIKPSTSGIIRYPVGHTTGRGIAAGSDASQVTIDGVRITPARSGGGADVFVYAAGSTIKNSVVDTIDTNQTQSNNITNAAYEALP